MSDGFRVQRLLIEGFKGFASSQTIDFKGRHVFLLGKNGNGKSSIIEAIRWGLFGSVARPNEIVENRNYPNTCRVVVSLTSDQELWDLRRSLLRGTSGSDATLTDSGGVEHPIRKIMPQLGSVDAGEGTYIIFSSQATSLRRQPQDLSPFERTVLNHLGLTHPRSLLSEIDEILRNQQNSEDGIGKDLSEKRDEIRSRVKQVEDERALILNAPPWDGDQPPSVVQSEGKAKELIAKITGESSDESLAGVSLDGLIDRAERAMENVQSPTELEEKSAQVAEEKRLLEEFRNARDGIAAKHREIAAVQGQLDDTLGGTSFDALKERIGVAKKGAELMALRQRAIVAAVDLLSRIDTECVHCPVCEADHRRADLESALKRVNDQLSDCGDAGLRELEDQLSRAEEFLTHS